MTVRHKQDIMGIIYTKIFIPFMIGRKLYMAIPTVSDKGEAVDVCQFCTAHKIGKYSCDVFNIANRSCVRISTKTKKEVVFIFLRKL